MIFEKAFHIDSFRIAEGATPFVVAEIGINHNGDMTLAKEMIDAAHEAGAHSVKFQNYHVDDFLKDKTITYTYTSQNRQVTESMWDMFKRCELSFEQLKDLKQYCDNRGVIFHSTPTGLKGLEELLALNVPVLKNGSDYLSHLPLIRAFGRSGLPTVLSTGMATFKEIAEACEAFYQTGNKQLILLHCTSSYPTPPESVNLKQIVSLKNSFGCLTGFSDHSEGNIAALGAVALGSVWIEKHFTTDKNLPGPDHHFSSTPEEFEELVTQVQLIEKQKGCGDIMPTPDEKKNRRAFRLSCVASKHLPSGHLLSSDDIDFCRPGEGIAPREVHCLIGGQLKHDVAAGQLITPDMLN